MLRKLCRVQCARFTGGLWQELCRAMLQAHRVALGVHRSRLMRYKPCVVIGGCIGGCAFSNVGNIGSWPSSIQCESEFPQFG